MRMADYLFFRFGVHSCLTLATQIACLSSNLRNSALQKMKEAE